ncbi:Rne/Rng family ribonuclease [Rothia kristinae]|nr:Rne/Rng family ribonuclease [Rothia kristinae]MCA1169093.1 Rne/Rng family ribonuclease [Rothia kristinae]MCT1358311.1 Rne/Rng family ribonuclease [Rothia kristinae]MCT1394088.1 Rne/Rng family ribonuclease [Rothia kristinae]MCT1506777.1 Rne/Rng family ribonuclease [Rothia kristinae]MCT2039518.1 Rne/Rng family ribonuclease [Rothia kristinae]
MSTQNDGAAPRGEDAETAPAASSVPEVAADPFGATSVLFKAPDIEELKAAALAKKQQEKAELEAAEDEPQDDGEVVARKRRRRRRGDTDLELVDEEEDPNTVTKVRTPRIVESTSADAVTSVKGSTRLEAKRQRRRESRASGRRRHGITEAEFLARRESVDRQMIVRQKDERIQIGVLEDGVLAEHFVSQTQQDSLIGNVYLGKVQNVLPSMEAAFIDIGRGRNAVLYAGEVNWDAAGLDGAPRRIERALKSGDSVLVQVTKDPIGHKGPRLTSQISLPGRFLVYVPGGSMTGISRKLPDTERARLKKILKDHLPDGAGVIVRTAAEGASEEDLAHDINRLRVQWEEIQKKANSRKTTAPELLSQEPDLSIKTVRDVFNEDFSAMVVQGQEAWDSIEAYVTYMAPDLVGRLRQWTEEEDVFDHYRIEEGLAKALDRKVFLPSGGSLVIDRTEAMTVIDVNTGKFTGSGGNLEETVTKNNLEAAEEIVRQLRLRDIGGIIVVDFIDMVLESNRDLVLRRLVECLGRDRTKHQVAEVTSLGLVQMTRKRMGTGLLEVFSEPCEACDGRGVVVHDEPLKGRSGGHGSETHHRHDRHDRKRSRNRQQREESPRNPQDDARAEAARTAFATIAAASSKHEDDAEDQERTQQAASSGDSVEQHDGAGQESKAAKKRKRRKRGGRSRGEQAETQQGESSQNGSQAQGETAHAADGRDEAGSGHGLPEDPDMVVTIHGEVVTLPHGEQKQPAQEQEGSEPSLDLDSLSEAFDRKAPREGAGTESSAVEDSPREDAPRGESRRGRTREDSASSVEEETGLPAPRRAGTTRSARAGRTRREDSRRAGREAADAARQAALEALEDMKPGRRSRRSEQTERGGQSGAENSGSATSGTGKSDAGQSGSAQERGGRTRGEDRQEQGRRSGTSRTPRRAQSPARTAQDPAEQRPTVTGVATPGASRRSEQPDQAQESAQAALAAPAQEERARPASASRPKRRSRRASSDGGQGGSIVAGQQGEASGVRVATAAAAPSTDGTTAAAAQAEEVMMLGVGVKAEDIRRPE